MIKQSNGNLNGNENVTINFNRNGLIAYEGHNLSGSEKNTIRQALKAAGFQGAEKAIETGNLINNIKNTLDTVAANVSFDVYVDGKLMAIYNMA